MTFRLGLFGLLMASVLLIAGCEGNSSNGNDYTQDTNALYVEDSRVCLGVVSGEPWQITDDFFGGDTVHLWVMFGNASGNHTAVANWYNPNGDLDQTYSLPFRTDQDRHVVDLSLSLIESAPVGDWEVELRVDDTFMRSHLFRVNAVGKAFFP